MSRHPAHPFILSILTVILSTTGCTRTYYAAMEKVGVHKRDILVTRVEKARDAQQNAQKQFQSALQQLQTLTQFEGGDLQKAYDAARESYENSQKSADAVSDRIQSVESVSGALFKEWKNELKQMSSDRLREASSDKLQATQAKYKSLMQSMHRAEAKMPPVLTALKDNMLYLKHNLNAAAIGSLDQEFKVIQNDIQQLIAEMNQSIQRSNEFIESLTRSE